MVRLLPLGGLGEVGMNCLAIEQRGEVILVDCGVTFDDRGLGIDVIHPDFSALDTFGARLAGVVITHGHEDHIGALPYLLKRFDVPVWGPPYALGLVKERLGEHEVLAHARLTNTHPREAFTVGSFGIEPIRVTHSIADATALAITTDAGMVIHTGDFKLDDTPPDGEHFDEARLRELGDAGVTLLMSDSTNIDSDGPTGSEAGVGDVLEAMVEKATGAVVVAMFASNVHRLRLLGGIAKKTGRKLVLLGRGVGTHAKVARSTGYLPWSDGLVVPDGAARQLPRDQILAIATGSQGEERAALARLARGDHQALDVGPGDTVILSARAIPGNEPEVYAMVSALIKRGCEVKTRLTDRGVHVSGHAHRPEQRRMIEIVRPRAFIPLHGTLHHLNRHANLAREVGIENVAVMENGRIVEVTKEGVVLGGKLPSGRVHVFAGREVPAPVIRDREVLAQEGFASASLALDAFGTLLDVSLATRGVLDESASDGARELEGVKDAVRDAVAELSGTYDDAKIAEHARLAIRRTFQKTRGKKPMTVVHVRRSSSR